LQATLQKTNNMADYQVKEMQQHILSVLLRVDKVCREHGITYYLSDGSMLGAKPST
jgi:lipopolysaccharide cholinephosphotransferase